MKRFIFLTILAISVSAFAISCSNSPTGPAQNNDPTVVKDTVYDTTVVNDTTVDTVISFAPSKADAYIAAQALLDTSMTAFEENAYGVSPLVGDTNYYMSISLTTITQINGNTFTLAGAITPFFWYQGNPYYDIVTYDGLTVVYSGEGDPSNVSNWTESWTSSSLQLTSSGMKQR